MRQPSTARIVAGAATTWGALALVALSGCTRLEPAAEPVRAVRTITVAPAVAAGQLQFAAEVKPRVESRLGFRVGGKIARRLVNVGDTVKAGQVLAELDPRDLGLAQDSARAALVAAQANFDLAAADFKRYQDLFNQGFIGAAELERRDAAMKAARATLDQSKAQVSVQGNQAAYARLLADAAGIVTAVEAESGTVVAAGTPVIRLAHDGPRDVVFAVPEDRIGSVKAIAATPGSLRVRLWGAGDDTLPATLREVSAAADAVTRTFQIKADVGAAASARVQIGQTATVLADLPKAAGITRLPLSALKEERGQSVVWLVDPATMTVRPQPVTVGGAQGNEAVIDGGLQPGQVVVTAGVHVLSPGQKVKFYVDPGQAASAAGAQQGTPVALK